MKLTTKNGLTLSFILAAVMSVALISSPDKAVASEADSSNQEETVVEVDESQSEPTIDQQEQEEVAKAEVSYEYIAQDGDSYSVIARKAVQTYGLKYEITLTNAQIMFAETMLTQEAGSPFLNFNQNLTIKESRIKYFVEEALKLTEEQQAAWDYYAQMADFNTDAVGQSQV